MYLIFWWASLCTLLYLDRTHDLCLCGVQWVPQSPGGASSPQAALLTSPSQQAVIRQIRQQTACGLSLRSLPPVTAVPAACPPLPGPATRRGFELLPASQERRPKPSSGSLGPSPTLAAVISTSRWKANCVPALKDLQGSSFYNLCRNLVLTSHNSRREEAFFS